MTQYEFMAGLKRMMKTIKNGIDIYEVVAYEIDEETQSANVKVRKMLEKTAEDNIVVSGIGLGNNKGIVCGYEVGDMLLCVNYNGDLIILTTLYNQFYSTKDSMVLPLEKELILKNAGGAMIKFTEDGGFEILNLNGNGIKMDKDDNVRIDAQYIDYYQI